MKMKNKTKNLRKTVLYLDKKRSLLNGNIKTKVKKTKKRNKY
jgi:hypothetical protein